MMLVPRAIAIDGDRTRQVGVYLCEESSLGCLEEVFYRPAYAILSGGIVDLKISFADLREN